MIIIDFFPFFEGQMTQIPVVIIVVDHGYITQIERNGITYRLKHRKEHDNSEKEYECSYIMHRAIDALHSGLYYLVEGV